MQILLEIFAIAVVAALAARFAEPPTRGRLLGVLKAWVTLRAFWLIVSHPVATPEGSQEVALRVVLDTLRQVDAGTFWTFAALAAGIHFVGLLASMYRWILLLGGQGIELPFRHIFGSFLIGRVIGTFLPGSAGLDGYKLFDAARFSGRSVEVATCTALEKLLGISGIFLAFLVALPFGIGLFGESSGVAACVIVPLCVGLVGGPALLLSHPGLLQRAVRTAPFPGRARLSGGIERISRAAASYRDKRSLLATAIALSTVMSFSTAAMFYFAAPAIGAESAEFWPLALGPLVRGVAAALAAFGIAGGGLLEAARDTQLSSMIGPTAATVATALGFFAAQTLTLVGGLVWWLRGPAHRPAYCLVDGQQVDYERSAREAGSFGADDAARADPLPAFAARLLLSAGLGLGSGILSGIVIGIAEALVIAIGGFGDEAQLLWYAPLNYGALLGLMGLVAGSLLSLLPMDEAEIRGWTPTLTALATLLPIAVAIAWLHLHDAYGGQMPPLGVLTALFGSAGTVAIALYFRGPLFFRTRLAHPLRPGSAISALLVTTSLGIVASVAVLGAPVKVGPPPPLPSELAHAPNLILVVADSLRADQLSCYGGPVHTPAICSLVEDGGMLFEGTSPAASTKSSIASILTSLLSPDHGAASENAVLPADVTLISEVLKERGYVTGGIVSSGELSARFGFDQGYDEYRYLRPDNLIGAEESSSRLALYRTYRDLFFGLTRSHRVGDYYQDSSVVNAAAHDFVSQYRVSRFFLFLQYMDPHDPYFAHPYDGRALSRPGNEPVDPAHSAEMKRLYRGEIEYLDANFQKFLDQLRAYGIYDDTVIAFAASPGEAFEAHTGQRPDDERIRVPLIVKWAAGREPLRGGGGARDRAARLIDVAPTLAALAGATPPAAAQGLALVGESAEAERTVLSEKHSGTQLGDGGTPAANRITAARE